MYQTLLQTCSCFPSMHSKASILACCRVHSLLLKPPLSIEGLVSAIKAGGPAFVATQGAPPLQRVLSQISSLESGSAFGGRKSPCMLIIGPEGDFTDKEMQDLLEAGAKAVGLGSNRLRVETAAIAMVAGALLHSESEG